MEHKTIASTAFSESEVSSFLLAPPSRVGRAIIFPRRPKLASGEKRGEHIQQLRVERYGTKIRQVHGISVVMEVTLTGGAPWGFRLQGGAGTGAPLTVYKVRRKSKAYRRLREGDRIVSVNGRSCERLTYEQLMDIADASQDTLTLTLQRRECDKENEAPEKSLPQVEEMVSVTSSKAIEVKEGARIQSVSLLDDVTPQKAEEKSLDPFPSFMDLQTDSCRSSQRDENHFTKTTTQTTHQVSGDTTSSFSRTEKESVSKSPAGLPDITLDTIDLNNLISETQKRLDSFRNTWTPSPSLLDSLEPIEKQQPPPSQVQGTSHSVDTSHESTSLEKTERKEKDSAFQLPDIGFSSQSSETITTDIPGGTATIIKKKKMFSSSSFYEEPESIYPTVEEQVELARKIADSLADDTNKKSKGANMFYKRLKRSTHWIHEGPEPSDESGPGTPEVEPPTPDAPFRLSKGPPRLKLLLDPRQPLDLNALRSSGYVISEHNVVSPEVCHGLVKDLQSPLGKGAALFAKRKKKSEEWVVDEERVKTMLREQQERKYSPAPQHYSTLTRQLQDVKLVKSPWEAAMESPLGLCDAAFARVRPDQLADTVMRRADSIRSESLSRESSRMEGCLSPTTLPPLQDIYHAKHPRGWEGNCDTVPYAPPQPVPQPQTAHNGYQGRKLVFQNFNAVPRVWKGASVH